MLTLPRRMAGKHILVVETDGDDAFLLARALNTVPSCSSYLCRSLDEARDYLSRSGVYQDAAQYPPADAIITELRLDLDSAFDLLQWMQQREPSRGLPVYILSDAISPQDMQRLEQLGAAGIFEKPAGTAELKTTLAAIAEKVCQAN